MTYPDTYLIVDQCKITLRIWYRLNERPNPSSPDDRRGLAAYDLEHLTPIGQTMKQYVHSH